MALAGYDIQVTTVRFPDPTAAKTVAVFKAPAVGATIRSAYAISDATVDNTVGTNAFTLTLLDGGQTGVGTAEVGAFGTGATDWVALTQQAATMTQYGLDGGDWLMAKYDEVGTIAPGNLLVCVHWTAGGS